MRIIPAILGILFFLTGVSLIFASGAEEKTSTADGLLLFHDVLQKNGIQEMQCEGFYRAELTNDEVNAGEITKTFEEINFNVANITEEDTVVWFDGLISHTDATFFLYREEEKTFLGLNVHDEKLTKILHAMEITAGAFSGMTSEEISTWTLKGSLDKKMAEEEMSGLAADLAGQMDGIVYEEINHPQALNVLGYSSLLTPGAQVNGNNINMNLAFKADSEENKTYFYAGVPFLSIPY